MPEYYTAKEVAEILRINDIDIVYKLLHEDTLKGFKLGSRSRISKQELQKFIRKLEDRTLTV